MAHTDWIDDYSGRTKRQRYAPHPPPDGLPLLNAEEHALLAAWVRSDSQTRSHRSLVGIKTTAAITPELADVLCDRLLAEGWISRQETLAGGAWRWNSLRWLALDRLKSLLGVSSRTQRQQDRAALLETAQDWLRQLEQADQTLSANDGAMLLSAILAPALQTLHADTALPLETLRQRLQLLQALADWWQLRRQGTRRDFALHARDHTKAIASGEWKWLTRWLDLEALGISRFVPLLTLAGHARLQWDTLSMDIAAADFITLPLVNLMRTTALSGSINAWWLIENRASFERQCAHPPPATLLVWLPGRPSPAWLDAVSHLLTLAPAPLRISADIDPSGVDIACTLGRRWALQNQPWTPHEMGVEQLQQARQQWPLNDYDHALLTRLLQDETLPPLLRQLCLRMQQDKRKAEQEGWL